MKPKSIIILGATGKVGLAALEIIKKNKDMFRVKTLIADGNNIKKLAQLAIEHSAEKIVISNNTKYHELQLELRSVNSYCEVFTGQSAIFDAVTENVDICISAISGIPGIIPTFAAIPHVKTLVLANKESLLCSGQILLNEVKKHNVTLIPVDIGHNGIFQILADDHGAISSSAVRSLTLTISRNSQWNQLEKRNSLKIPSSASQIKCFMINKSLEMIEAAYLFNIDIENIDILIQRKAMIHGIVQFKNGAQIMHVSKPDIKVPLSHAMSWPSNSIHNDPVSFENISDISFDMPDLRDFPIFSVARESWRHGSKGTIKFSTATKIVMSAFFAKRIHFNSIVKVIDDVMSANDDGPKEINNVLDIMAQYDVIVGQTKNILRKYYL